MKNFFFPILIVILISVNSFGQSGTPIELKFKLSKGSGYDYNADVDMNMKQNAAGQNVDFTNQMTMGYRFTVLEDSAGWKKMSTLIQHIAIKMNAGGVDIDYNSDEPVDTSNMMSSTISKVFSAMNGAEFTFTMNDKGEIGSINGIDELKNKMLAASPNNQMSGGFDNAFNEENFKQSMQQAFGFYPDKPVKIGDSWTKTMTTNSGGMQMKLDNTYTLESVSNNIACVKINANISSGSGIPLKGTMTGKMDYDIATGIPVNGNLNMLMNMSIDTGGQSTTMDLDITTTMTGKKF